MCVKEREALVGTNENWVMREPDRLLDLILTKWTLMAVAALVSVDRVMEA